MKYLTQLLITIIMHIPCNWHVGGYCVLKLQCVNNFFVAS